jgi:hypothetical protein
VAAADVGAVDVVDVARGLRARMWKWTATATRDETTAMLST